MSRRVYVAAPFSQSPAANRIAAVLREAGYRVESTWHTDLPAGATDATDPRTREEAAATCLAEVTRSDVVVAWTASGAPRGTYLEIGYALGLDRRVVWIQGPQRLGANVFDSDPRVTVVDDVTESALLSALEAVH
jgi:nucleoside 2-deoxyribosyltransferase